MKKIIIIDSLCITMAFLLMGQSKVYSNTKENFQVDFQKAIVGGEKVYKKYCISCHQADGGGVPNLNPPLIKTIYVLGEKERLIKIVLNGLNENIEIDGEYFSNPMPALGILKDQQIADVLTYVRNSFGNKASAISAAEVKVVRGKMK